MLCIYLSKIYTETAEISKKEDCEVFMWASHFIMNYKITVKYLNTCSEGNILPRMPNMQVLLSLLCKTPHKSNVALTDV